MKVNVGVGLPQVCSDDVFSLESVVSRACSEES